MSRVPCRKQSMSTEQPSILRRVVSVLALILIFIPLTMLRTPVAQATAVWPYSALQAELNTTYASVQQAIAPLPPINMTNHYIVPLFWADSSMGKGLIGTDRYGQPDGSLVNFNVQRCIQFLQTMQRAGFNSTLITVAWPLLDPTANYPGLQYYQSFYIQVVRQAKAMGFWVAMSSGISPTGNVTYGQYRSIDTVFAGRRKQAWWMATNLKPDWIIGGAEPSTDQILLRGIPDHKRLDANYWGAYFQALMAGKPSGTLTKYAGGASPHDPQAFFDAVVASGVDGVDGHPFPLTNSLLRDGNQYWQVMLNRFDQARTARKAILVTQTSPYKESAAETASARLSSNDIYLRDVWDRFQPQDQAWEAMWQQIVLKKGLTATCYWWANRTFLGGYIPYNPLLSYSAATTRVDSTSNANLQKPGYILNTEGRLWSSFAKTSQTSSAGQSR